MSIQLHDEALHPRDTTGKFATKPVADVAGGLDAFGNGHLAPHVATPPPAVMMTVTTTDRGRFQLDVTQAYAYLTSDDRASMIDDDDQVTDHTRRLYREQCRLSKTAEAVDSHVSVADSAQAYEEHVAMNGGGPDTIDAQQEVLERAAALTEADVAGLTQVFDETNGPSAQHRAAIIDALATFHDAHYDEVRAEALDRQGGAYATVGQLPAHGPTWTAASAVSDAMLALAHRDLLDRAELNTGSAGQAGWNQAAYDHLTRPYRTVMGEIHPHDGDL